MTSSKKTQENAPQGCFRYIMSRKFWINLALIGLFFAICIGAVSKWLQSYTHHSQRLELPDYVGWNYEEALDDARDNDFRMQVLDSIYVVGREGHEILKQNPIGGSLVKENRTIYVTITKKSADLISMSRIPTLYGKKYELKKKELLRSFEIRSQVVGERFDPGEAGHILAVIYEGDTIVNRNGRDNDVLIEKGGTLNFVISKNTGGMLPVPDLTCLTYAEAQFLLTNSGLTIGEIITDGNIGVVDSAFVSGQVPDPAEGLIEMGSAVKLSLTSEKPPQCR